MVEVKYNERSWAIDLISEINLYSRTTSKTIARAGGESSVSSNKKTLFPDVLLFGERSEILMGWELKMPDTPITDQEFIGNAEKKANILGLNGFLLWNGNIAVLYLKKGDKFEPKKTWDDLSTVIKNRVDVENLRNDWIGLLHSILKELNAFFDDGEIEKKTFVETFKDSSIVEFILRNNKVVSENLKNEAIKDNKFSAEANIWWRVAKNDYPGHEQWSTLANIILINWVNKFLFAHILVAFRDPAKEVENINAETTIVEAVKVFQKISSQCDFWNIFQPQLGETYIDNQTWSEIIELNDLLKELELSSVGHGLLQDLLQNIIYSSKRKVAGQYATPMALARLLVGLTMTNKEASFHDPCCGTGTIARAAYDIKKEAGIESKDALRSVYCSDKVAFPLQMATLSLTEPNNIGEIVQIFKEDCTKLKIGKDLHLKDPYTGESVIKQYEGVKFICSNLPFIQQEDAEVLNPKIKEQTNELVSSYLLGNTKMSSKSDVYAYLPFYLWQLLQENGKLGIVTSNSWLATEWGVQYKRNLSKFFKIECIVVSGKGRWFKNADVVTTIMVLSKRTNVGEVADSETTKFAVLNFDLASADNDEVQNSVDNIITGYESEDITIQTYKTQELLELDLNWNTLFSDISWLSEIKEKIIKASTLFQINRGERRGWDPMFYPEQGHGIEKKYLRPVLKSPREIDSLITSAKSEAFCCSKSLEELEQLGDQGALNWINKFKHEVNGKGEPLVEKLKRGGVHWYEMKDSTLADLVASMNFDKRIFVAKLDERSFVNQRLTRFTAQNDSIDLDLTHALFNSVLGIFFIESIGFGRGLGALDLSSTRMRERLYMLNPDLLSLEQKEEIKNEFKKLKNRGILNLENELLSEDRKNFDSVVLNAFGIEQYKEKIISSLLTLYKIRVNTRS